VLDGGEPITEFRPSSCTLPAWSHGTGDGASVSASSVLPALIPPLAGSGRQQCHSHQDAVQASAACRSGHQEDAHPPSRGRDGRDERRSSARQEALCSSSRGREDRDGHSSRARSHSRHGHHDAQARSRPPRRLGLPCPEPLASWAPVRRPRAQPALPERRRR
jgi:hypothetical protein